jgi:FMN phosphatase YigB (HAD superfamily)
VANLALFDLDNTLVDRQAAFLEWAHEFADEHSLGDAASATLEVLDMDGLRPRTEFFGSVRRAFPITTPVDDLVSRYFVDYPRHFSVADETVDALRRLRAAGWKIGVVTNGQPSQRLKLDVTGLGAEVDAVCVSAEVGSEKPDKAIFEEAARRCGVPLAGWMVGDSAGADIAGGHGCGLMTIWMSRGRHWSSSGPTPDAIVATIPEAAALILGPN